MLCFGSSNKFQRFWKEYGFGKRHKPLKEELGQRLTVVSFPGAGHLSIVTEPMKAAAAVISFLQSVSDPISTK
jgi:hypothetical protein